MKPSDLQLHERVRYIPSGAPCAVIDQDNWSVTILDSHTHSTMKVNSELGLSLYEKLS